LRVIHDTIGSLNNHLHDVLKGPVTLLGPLEDLAALVGEVRLAIITSDMLEKDRLPCFFVGLALTGLFTLSFFELDLDLCGLAILLGVNGICNTPPEGQGLIGQLLLLGRNDLRRDVKRRNVDNCVLFFNRYRFLLLVSSVIS
jgi:hypothetical protein